MRGKSHSLPQYEHTIHLYSTLIRFYNSTVIQQYDSTFSSLPARVRPRIMREMGESGEEWEIGEEMGVGSGGEQFPLGE